MLLGSYRGPLSARTFLKVAVAQQAAYVEDLSFRVYITDSLQLMGEDKHLTERWYDVAHPKKTEEMDAMKIVESVIKNAGLEVKTK